MLLVSGDVDCRSAGSFFKNPVVPGNGTRFTVARRLDVEKGKHFPPIRRGDGEVKLSAAWLIERAGYQKGFSLGETRESPAVIRLP